MSRRFLASTVAIVASLAWAVSSAAQEPAAPPNEAASEANDAYGLAKRAFDTGDYAIAAPLFARADELSPHPLALRLAITSAIYADNPILGMTLVERAKGRAPDPELDAARSDATQKFAGRVARVTFQCDGDKNCRPSIDGKPTLALVPQFLPPGSHRFRIESKGGLTERNIALVGGQNLVLSEDPHILADDLAIAHAPPNSGGAHPAWFFTTLAVTAGLTAATIASAVDTKVKHDGYEDSFFTDRALFEDGQAAQLRTNVFVAVTAGGGIATLILGITTKWSDGGEARRSGNEP